MKKWHFLRQKRRSKGKGGLSDLARALQQWGVDLETLPMCCSNSLYGIAKSWEPGLRLCQPIAGVGIGGQSRVEVGAFRSCHRPYKSVCRSCEMEVVLFWNLPPLGVVLRSSSFVGCN